MRLDKGQIEVIDSAQASVLRRKTPAERLQIGFDIWDSSWRLLSAYLEQSHPEWSEDAVRREVAKRLSHGAV